MIISTRSLKCLLYKIPTKNLMPHVFNKTDIISVHHIPLIVGYRHFLKELKKILSFIWPKRETVYIAKILTNELYSFYTSWLCVYQKSQTNIDSFKLFFIFWDYRIIISFYLPFHSFKSSHITPLLTVLHIYGLFFICFDI